MLSAHEEFLLSVDRCDLRRVEDIPDELLQDPFWQRSKQTDRGRDGCRVPLPWSGEQPPFGFTADGARPWLPQPEGWKTLTAEAQRSDPGSMLALYKSALALRRAEPSLCSADLVWNEDRQTSCPTGEGLTSSCWPTWLTSPWTSPTTTTSC